MLLSSISLALTRLGQRLGRWSPLALWPDGVASQGMWISPSTLPASFNDYTGTTPVAVPGTVADSANPVGLALDIRAGAPGTLGTLGPELVTNGDFSDGTTGWTPESTTISVVSGSLQIDVANGLVYQQFGTVTGKTYRLTFDATFLASGYLHVGTPAAPKNAIDVNLGTTTGSKTFCFVATGTTTQIRWQTSVTAGIRIDNVSVKEVPGNHMLQATSAARPLESGRVNQIVSTDDLTGTGWAGVSGANTPTTLVDTRWQVSSIVGRAYQVVTMQFEAMAVSTATGVIARIDRDYVAQGNEQTFAINSASWTLITKTATLDNGTNPPVFRIDVDGTGAVYIRHCQIESGAVATAYQQVNTASDYDATGITPFQLYDGTDDGMATASFAAGTLIDGMDCMIAVRRDSAASCVAGLYNGIADATKFFGMAESASGSGCVGSGAGTPTAWVDNTQLTGGTAVTRGTLHTALTVGDWHILEFRNLDLSTWTAAGFGLYTSYLFPGPRGDILLYPSTTPTTDKDAARQWLADYYGVTLP